MELDERPSGSAHSNRRPLCCVTKAASAALLDRRRVDRSSATEIPKRSHPCILARSTRRHFQTDGRGRSL